MRSRVPLSMLLFVACLILPAPTVAAAVLLEKRFVHPGMLHSRADLEFIKRKVLAGEQPWKDAWDAVHSASWGRRRHRVA